MTGVRIAREEGLARLLLARGVKGNALDAAMGRQLREAAAELRADQSVRAVLLEAEGSAFCVGGDLSAMGGDGDIAATIEPMAVDFNAAIADLASMTAPLIVAVQGVAAGAGLSLVGIADYAVAARAATFSYAYPGVGLTADGGPTWSLPRLVGLRAFQSLYLGGARWSADDALARGLVNEIVDDAELAGRALGFARRVAGGPTRAYAAIKRLAAASLARDLPAQLDAELAELLTAARTNDARGAIAAVLARGRPSFGGR